MGDRTKIEWADATFNPWVGCTQVSPGCDHCYADGWAKRSGLVKWGSGASRRRTSESTWRQPLRWDAAHEAFYEVHGRRRRVFCASLADVFDNEAPAEWRADLFRLIEATPHLDWMLLTKRIGNAGDMMFVARGGHLPLLRNVWLGATVVNQVEADRDIPKLLATPAAVRFLSIEPMLGPIDLTRIPIPRGTAEYLGGTLPRIDWVVVGGESGPKARPMHPEWARSLRDQCANTGVPFFMKQMGGARDKRGAMEELPEELRVRDFPQRGDAS